MLVTAWENCKQLLFVPMNINSVKILDWIRPHQEKAQQNLEVFSLIYVTFMHLINLKLNSNVRIHLMIESEKNSKSDLEHIYFKLDMICIQHTVYL